MGRPTDRHEDKEDNRRGRPSNKATGIASSVSEQIAPLLPRLFAGQLPFENRAPFRRLFGICKDIDFIPRRFDPRLFDNDFFEKSFVKVVFPGTHQLVCCLILIFG
jgi:hypothetical protein